MRNTVVLGLGNALLSDEGVGVHVVRRLVAEGSAPGVELLEAGSAGMKLIHLLAGRERAVLIDCALMGEPPGTIRRFRPGEVRSIKALAGFSAHEGDILTVLRLCRELGNGPDDVVILGIEPAAVGPGHELSDGLASRMDEYVAAVRECVSGGCGK